MVTRSYDNDYKCIACHVKRSMFGSDTCNVSGGDENLPDTFPVMADGTCPFALRYSGMTVE